MSDTSPNLDSLFAAAVEIESAAERAAFVDQSCGENDELRQQLEQLLESDQQTGELDNQPVQLDATFLTDAAGNDLAAALSSTLRPAGGCSRGPPIRTRSSSSGSSS